MSACCARARGQGAASSRVRGRRAPGRVATGLAGAAVGSPAFSLVELLVTLAVIALLISILLPALREARGQAWRVCCAARLNELGRAFQMYAVDFEGRAMPLAYTRPAVIGTGPPVYWWGTNAAGGVDHTRGFVWPYLQSDLRADSVFECPAQPAGTYACQGTARQITSTFGYNGYYLSPGQTPGWDFAIGHRPWRTVDCLPAPQRLFVFADTLIALGRGLPQNNALLDPPWVFLRGQWVVNPSPTTVFRHRGRANAALADGHVESFGPAGGRVAWGEAAIGSVGADNDPHYVPDWREW